MKKTIIMLALVTAIGSVKAARYDRGYEIAQELQDNVEAGFEVQQEAEAFEALQGRIQAITDRLNQIEQQQDN